MNATARRLPVAWDGHPVEWGEFTADPFMCQVNMDGTSEPLPPGMCWHCGVRAEHVTTEGRVVIPNWPYRLVLRRCTRCGHDRVRNPLTEQEWELDESDYGPSGSWEDAS
ncbi:MULTISPECIES: hypothetical protein [unclassified Rhodococcus (in: high G+C Gram-positive bacteria)]|uniref:hypothetical protein n=1 Tax=unclassified Rhodococcus (in: high G+C Gram-positive bacteria) TaxID=192944 RepID=UPI0009271294|nr:hypothetical protein [Rhodococcus sp. M8]OLL21232.1 hypothetical protein BKE56_015595 [Rhodococcus sp. M8]